MKQRFGNDYEIYRRRFGAGFLSLGESPILSAIFFVLKILSYLVRFNHNIIHAMKNSEFEDSEKECQRIRIDNALLLETFKSYLESKGLKSDTVKSHVDNIDFYLTFTSFELEFKN